MNKIPEINIRIINSTPEAFTLLLLLITNSNLSLSKKHTAGSGYNFIRTFRKGVNEKNTAEYSCSKVRNYHDN